MKHDQGSTTPLRVKEIIQESLAPISTWGPPGKPLLATTLSRENSRLLTELEKAQSLLTESRKECNELGLKFIDASEKVVVQHN